MENKIVLVTGLGGNVGQGIARNIIATKYPITIVGCNVESFSAGNYLCDFFEKVPYAYEDNYLTVIGEIVLKYNIDLIIPSTDYEAYYLSRNINLFSCQIAVSSSQATEIYLDKWLTALHHKNNGIPFATSLLPSQFQNNFSDFILKPKKGRGSRGLFINPENPSSFSDEDYLLQELAKGKEITTSFYINKEGLFHGMITMERTLENGTTNFSKVITNFDDEIYNKIMVPMMKSVRLVGSINIQSIVTDNKKIIPFEINCRISGTNSIRSNFGFKDVQYTLQEYLYNQQPDKVNIINGIAVRVLLDIIYPNATSVNNLLTNQAPHIIF